MIPAIAINTPVTPLLRRLGLTCRELYLMSMGKKPIRETEEPVVYRFKDYEKGSVGSEQVEKSK